MFLIPLALGLFIECLNAAIYSRTRASGIPLVGPVLIAVGAALAPSLGPWLRVGITSAGWLLHFMLPLLVPRPTKKTGPREVIEDKGLNRHGPE